MICYTVINFSPSDTVTANVLDNKDYFEVKNCLLQSLLLWTDQSFNIFFLFWLHSSVSLKTHCIMLTSSHSAVKIFEMISLVVDQGPGVFIYTTASVTAELLRTACLNFTIQVLTAQTVFLVKEINYYLRETKW